MAEQLVRLWGDSVSASQGTQCYGVGKGPWVKAHPELGVRGGKTEREKKKPVSFNLLGFLILFPSTHINAHSLMHKQELTPAQCGG